MVYGCWQNLEFTIISGTFNSSIPQFFTLECLEFDGCHSSLRSEREVKALASVWNENFKRCCSVIVQKFWYCRSVLDFLPHSIACILLVPSASSRWESLEPFCYHLKSAKPIFKVVPQDVLTIFSQSCILPHQCKIFTTQNLPQWITLATHMYSVQGDSRFDAK